MTERVSEPELSIRPLRAKDRPAIEALLDEAIGRGFWDPAHDLDGIAIVALADGRLAGVATASVEPDLDRAAEATLGTVRLVAVDPAFRQLGVGTRLVAEVVAICEARGADRMIAYAWVHGPHGRAPLAGTLKRAGFSLDRRIEGFYGGAAADQCPACGEAPCICPADVYRRSASGIRG